MPENTFPMPNLLRTGSDERLRLESVVNMLLDLGVLRENLEIIAEGGFRKFRGEIIRQSPEPGTQVGSNTKVTLWVTQEGIADNLPESLFGFSAFLDRKEPTPTRAPKDFFLPLDSLSFQTSALLHRIAQVYGLLFSDPAFSRYFLTMFGFPEPGWDREELSVWQAILPYASGWIGTR